jgi:hypothetical protein
MYIYMYIYIYIYTCVYIYMHMHMHTHIYLHTNNPYTNIYTYIPLDTRNFAIFKWPLPEAAMSGVKRSLYCKYMCIYMHVCTYIYMHVCIYIHMYIYIYVYM